MLQQKANMRAEGALDDAESKAEFSRLRTRYQRLRRDAKEAFRVQHFESLVDECNSNPRALWSRLGDSDVSACPIEDMDAWRTHFDNLFNGESNATDVERAKVMLCQLNYQVLQDGNDWVKSDSFKARADSAAGISAPFSCEEVCQAIKRLRNNKSCGPGKIPAECLKRATRMVERKEVNVTAPLLRVLFEHIRSTGDFPSQFISSVLTPIHKKGDVMDMSNYRGLAVGGVLAKLYAFLLENRLNGWSENCGARSPYQGGFRRKRGTVHNIFALRHLLDSHRRAGGAINHPLFVCQIDFEKAFDRVPRDLLWLRLEERGLSPEALKAIKACYDKVTLKLRVNGATGCPFESSQGVKQGCPLSPTLYGIFGESFADFIDVLDRDRPSFMYANKCPCADGFRIPLLLYADDLSLFARSRARLERLLQMLGLWCATFGMRVNVKKTEILGVHANPRIREVMGLGPPFVMSSWENGQWASKPIDWVGRARYLGIHYGPDLPFVSCTDELFSAGQRAIFSLINKLRRQGLLLPGVGLKCFNAQIRPILSYGAQVWAPDLLVQILEADESRTCLFDRAVADRMVGLQLSYLRALACVKTATTALVFREFGQHPLHLFWARLIFRFWNKLVESESSIYHHVFREELRFALMGDGLHDSWGAKVLRVLRALGYDVDSVTGSLDTESKVDALSSHKLDIPWLLGELKDRLDAGWANERLTVNPRDFVSDNRRPGVKMCRYEHWMGDPSHLKTYIPSSHHRSLIRFRLCCWAIEVNRPNGRTRADRVCPMCNTGAVEDEYHVFLECPAYEGIRQNLQLSDALPNGNMCAVMTLGDQRLIAKALHEMRRLRSLSTGIPV
ncbi:hypothetical protein PLESTB_001538400 [Pleodorina starrii]|uniref:Reverse transcriptase domain-containing protein n=1 Tax=Pleodorina starrii TaxID=330485 RepID=A0A9W6BX28_9CHLO|nr:hypothetical protein PLESTM_001843600 [Pleodorina starrii]GLC59813.1 hypothetical protein PLESTB_001538400 [Pleodorina starrii]